MKKELTFCPERRPIKFLPLEMASNSAKKVTTWVCLKLNIDTISGEDILFVKSSVDNHSHHLY